MTMLKRVRVLAAKIETAPGTAETLLAANATNEVFDVEIQPNISMNTRDRTGTFAPAASVVGTTAGTVSFKTELKGDGAGGLPVWASTFLPACGMVATGGVYKPVSEVPGSNVKTLTIGVYEDGIKKSITGAMGNARFVFSNGLPVAIEFTFQGIWVVPTTTAILTSITYDSNSPFVFKGIDAFTVGGVTPACINSFAIDLGNEVVMRPCATAASGFEHAVITGRMVKGSFDPESVTPASNDIYQKWLDGDIDAINLEMADTTDNIQFDVPYAQRQNIQEGDRGGIQTDNVEFIGTSLGVDGDDFTITFAAVI